jgi:hypothetical protein
MVHSSSLDSRANTQAAAAARPQNLPKTIGAKIAVVDSAGYATITSGPRFPLRPSDGSPPVSPKKLEYAYAKGFDPLFT